MHICIHILLCVGETHTLHTAEDMIPKLSTYYSSQQLATAPDTDINTCICNTHMCTHPPCSCAYFSHSWVQTLSTHTLAHMVAYTDAHLSSSIWYNTDSH